MANTLITSSIILNEALLELKNNAVLAELVDRQYSNQFGNGQTLKRGDSVKVRRRVNFAATNVFSTDGDMTSNVSDVVEGSADISLDHQESVVFEVSSQDLTLDISEFSSRYIRPMMIELAQRCESDIAREFQKAPWLELGPTDSFVSVATLDAILDDYGVPMMDRCMTMTPTMMVDLSNVLTTVFPKEIATRAIERALVTELGNLKLYKFQSSVNHTVGAQVGAFAVAGATQEVDYVDVKDNDYLSQTLNVGGLDVSTAGILNAGDTFTIAGVFQVNHRTREATSRLQQFNVLTTAASDGGGLATLSITPAIITTGAFKTVDILDDDTLIDSAVCTPVSGAAGVRYAEGMAFHKQALTLATADLEAFRGGVDNSTGNLDGYAMRIAIDSDVLRDKTIVRADMLYGVRLLEVRAVVRQAETDGT